MARIVRTFFGLPELKAQGELLWSVFGCRPPSVIIYNRIENKGDKKKVSLNDNGDVTQSKRIKTVYTPSTKYIGGIYSFCIFYNYVCLFVNFFLSKISQQLLWLRILKFGTKLDSDELYCVKKQSHIAYQSLYLFIFLSLQWKFLSQFLSSYSRLPNGQMLNRWLSKKNNLSVFWLRFWGAKKENKCCMFSSL